MASASTTSVITSSFPSAHFAGPKPYPQQSPSRVHFRSLRVTASACASTAERTREAPRHVASSSLYEVLGVQAGATCQEIKAAYRKLARVLHPDVNTDQDDHEFIRLHEAYATLSDPQKRADYDRSLFWRGMSSSMTMARGATASAGYTTSRRWETDQCW